MPCRGLPSLAADFQEPVFNRISFRQWSQSLGSSVDGTHTPARVVVDGVALLYFIFSKTEWSFGGEGDALRQATLQFCASLRRVGISPLVLFDGVISHSNYVGGIRKTSEKIGKIAQAVLPFENQPFRFLPRTAAAAPCLPPFAQEVVIEALHSAGVQVRVCEEECARCVHGAAVAAGVPLIGYDSNYLTSGACGCVHSDSLLRTKDGDIQANLVVPARFAEALGLKHEHLTVLSFILGNEVAPEWAFATLHRSVAGASCDDRRVVVAGVANWIAQQTDAKSNREIAERAIDLEVNSMLGTGGPGIPDTSACLSRAHYQQATVEQRREILQIFFERSEELLSPLPLTHKVRTPMTFFEQATAAPAPTAVSGAYFRGDFPALLLSVLSTGVAWIKPCLENLAHQDAAADAAAGLRAASYGLMLSTGTGSTPQGMVEHDLHVREAIRVGSEYVLRNVTPKWTDSTGKALPAWSDLRQVSQDDRRRLLYDLAGVVTPEHQQLIENLPADWRLVGLALAVNEKNVDNQSWETLALIEHIIAPPHHAVLTKLHADQRLARGPEDLRRAAQWQHILLGIGMLNAVLGFPIPSGSALGLANAVNDESLLGGPDTKAAETKPANACLAALFNGMAFCHARSEARNGTSQLVRARAELAAPASPPTNARNQPRRPAHVTETLRRARIFVRVAYGIVDAPAPAPAPARRPATRFSGLSIDD